MNWGRDYVKWSRVQVDLGGDIWPHQRDAGDSVAGVIELKVDDVTLACEAVPAAVVAENGIAPARAALGGCAKTFKNISPAEAGWRVNERQRNAIRVIHVEEDRFDSIVLVRAKIECHSITFVVRNVVKIRFDGPCESPLTEGRAG